MKSSISFSGRFHLTGADAYEIAVDRAWAHAIEGAEFSRARKYDNFSPRLMRLRAARKGNRPGSTNPPLKTCIISWRWR